MLARTVCLTLLLALPSIPALADGPWGPPHKHATGDVVEQRDASGKWPVDDALQFGMGRIALAVDKLAAAVRADKATAAGYDALAGRVRTEVGAITRSSHVVPEAEEQLQAVLVEVRDGVEMIEGKRPGTERRTGLARLIRALDSYGKHFDHPGWRTPTLGD